MTNEDKIAMLKLEVERLTTSNKVLRILLKSGIERALFEPVEAAIKKAMS